MYWGCIMDSDDCEDFYSFVPLGLPSGQTFKLTPNSESENKPPLDTKKQSIIDEKTIEYYEGSLAYKNGKDSFNPYDYYVSQKKHLDWKKGYWDSANIDINNRR